MQILRVQNFCTSASHKCNFVLNQAKGRKSAVFFFPKKKISTTNCFGNAWAPRSCPNCSLFTSASSTHRPLFLALTDSALPTRKRLRLPTPARWLQDQPPLLSALQYRSRIAMRTWRRPLLKRMTILHASASHKCNIVLNQAQGRKSAVFFFLKNRQQLLWQCLGTTLLPKLLTLHICFVHSPPPLPGTNGQRPANMQALASSNFQLSRRVQN